MTRRKSAERKNAIIYLARQQHWKDGEVEIDDDAKVSEGPSNGAYVQAWVWVDFTRTKLDKEGN